MQHSMSCKKGGFISIRYNNVRDLAGKLLSNLYHNIQVELKLLALSGKQMEQRSGIDFNEVRLDIWARGFGILGQQVFLDVRIFEPSTCRFSNPSLAQ